MALRIGRSRLPELLKIRGMSQTDFARRLGVSDSFVSQVIHGKAFFSIEMAMNASFILNCTIEQLHEWHLVGNR